MVNPGFAETYRSNSTRFSDRRDANSDIDSNPSTGCTALPPTAAFPMRLKRASAWAGVSTSAVMRFIVCFLSSCCDVAPLPSACSAVRRKILDKLVHRGELVRLLPSVHMAMRGLSGMRVVENLATARATEVQPKVDALR